MGLAPLIVTQMYETVSELAREGLSILVAEQFARTAAEMLLTYALGRGLEPSDLPVVRRIVKKAAQNDYRFTSIIVGIVESPAFQMRTRLEPSEPTNTVAQARVQQP